MSQESAGRDHRRQEARAIPWGELIPQHRIAVRRVLELIQSAVDALPKPQREAPSDPMSVASALRVRHDRTSQLAFIDGGRGTGKTSVELSLRDALLSPEGLARMSGGVVSPEHQDEIESLARIAKQIHPHLEWLIPLDMEPMPAGVNVLAAILVRIEQALRDTVADDREAPTGWLARSDRGDELMTTLDTLRTDVVHAWDGGLRERSPGQNLHAWSQEVLDAERARLNLVERLTFLLDRIAWHRHQRGHANPLFVLVVDDFDLSPNHCVELLRVVRMITTPRLFFIFAGHLDMARDVMHLKSAGDASTLAGSAGRLASCASRVEQMARGVAVNNLRKLVPPAHRIELGPLGADEVAQVYLSRPKKDTPIPFVEKLKQWQLQVGGIRCAMSDFLLGPWVGETAAAGDEIAQLRFFQSFFHVPIRTLVDTDMALSRLVWDDEAPDARRLMDVITRELERRLDEVGDEFPDEAREALRLAVRERKPSRGCLPALDSSLAHWRHTNRAQRYTVEHTSWQVVSTATRPGSPISIPLSISAGLMILHDLNVETGNVPDESFMSHFVGRIASLGWNDHPHAKTESKLPLNWPSLTWERIGDALLFLSLWSITVVRGADTAAQPLYCWLRAWYAVEGRNHPFAFEPFDASRLDALFAIDHLGPVRSDGSHSAVLHRRLEVAAMLRPELGWEDASVKPLLDLPHLASFLRRADVAGAMRGLRTRAMQDGHIRLVSPRAWAQLRHQVAHTLDMMRASATRVTGERPRRIVRFGEEWSIISDILRTNEAPVPEMIDAIKQMANQSFEQLTHDLARQTDARAREYGAWLRAAAKALQPRWDLLRDAIAPDASSAFNQFTGADGAEGILCPDLTMLEAAGVISPLELPPLPDFTPPDVPAPSSPPSSETP